MSNCKAELNLHHQWVNVTNENDVLESLKSLLNVDNDLTENEEYFRKKTLKLGYENEAERIVKELLDGKTINTIESFKQIAKKVAKHITGQEYYGNCELSFVAIDKNTLIIAFATGGN
jgi:hypothetical protein